MARSASGVSSSRCYWWFRFFRAGGGEAGAQLAALYDEDSSKAYERVKFYDPDGDEVMCPLQNLNGKLSVSAQVSEGAAEGDVYTLKAKVADTAGELHELSHEYVVG